MARNAVVAFGVDLVERAAKTGAQAALLALGGQALNQILGGWVVVAVAAGGGFVTSVLTSVGSIPLGNTESPSLVNSKQAVQSQLVQTAAISSSDDVLAAGNAIFPV